jgi:hypothetical protein
MLNYLWVAIDANASYNTFKYTVVDYNVGKITIWTFFSGGVVATGQERGAVDLNAVGLLPGAVQGVGIERGAINAVGIAPDAIKTAAIGAQSGAVQVIIYAATLSRYQYPIKAATFCLLLCSPKRKFVQPFFLN